MNNFNINLPDNCGCNTPYTSYNPYPSDPCCTGPLLQLDFKDVIYHKDNNTPTELDGLGLTNGSTLQLVTEILDEKIKGLNVLAYNIPGLRADGVVNTPQQFAQAVDVSLTSIKSRVTTLEANGNVSLIANDSQTIDFVTSGTFGHTLTGSVKLSANATNSLIVTSDGLYNTPQALTIDYSTKKLTITGGNTIDLSSIACTAAGYLGAYTTAPSPIQDGQSYYNISSDSYYVKLNNVLRQIVLV